MPKISKYVEDKIALERHEMLMKMSKSAFTIICVLAFIIFGFTLYTSIKTGEFPTMANLVDLLNNLISSVLKAS